MGGFVYFIQALPNGPIKIGRAADPEFRRQELQTGNAAELAIIGTVSGGGQLERELHRRLKSEHLRGEWFRDSALLRGVMSEIGATCQPHLREQQIFDPSAHGAIGGRTRCENCGVPFRHGEFRLCQACREFEEIRASGEDPFSVDEPLKVGRRRRSKANLDA